MEKKIFDYSLNADKDTLQQFKECYSKDFVKSAALMPDAHKGYAAPIGAVLLTKDYIVPSWVGFDIGCGMIAIRIRGKDILKKIKDSKNEIYNKILNKIPMGVGEYKKEKNISEKTREEFRKLLIRFEKGPYDKDILNLLRSTSLKNLGTLGGGNHFIELDFYKKEVWLVIHSGSRGLGYKVAKRYMIRASKSEIDYEKTFPLSVISQLGKEYLNILEFGLDYALLNRLEMSYEVIGILEEALKEKLKTELWVNKNHNHAIYENGFYIHRKGATPAKKGEKGIIPANMRDGSFLVVGLGNSNFLNSSTHGAGRSLSRKEAKEKISMEEFKKSMEGIKGTISIKTLDEAPMAYKDINKVMKAQEKSVRIIKHLLPIINWKG
jgi:tRNA-splicing ligase RtcB